jgi:glutathione S-transferase
MLTLFGHPGSTCTRKVLTALAETGTPYEFSLVDLAKGEHKQQPHLARQPFGQIPAIDHDGFMLYESRAICRYLSSKAGHPLTPNNDQERARMDQWLSVEQSNYSPSAMKFVYHHVFKRPQEVAVLEAAAKMLATTYEALSEPLAENTFITGEQFTIADIGFMPYIEYLETTPAKEVMAKYPKVVAWWKRVSARPSWQKAIGKS